jgi:2,4-dienoyl-CoA reductase-like NADH-dependent reductase (Old Yellow Enzyme family)
MTTTKLFAPLEIRSLHFKNRIFVSPMCQYSAIDGVPNDWHFVHLGSRAVGGAAFVMTEATAVTAEGRISPGDTGLWNDTQTEAFSRISKFIISQDSIPGIQLAHAGRKASTNSPWVARGAALKPGEGGWQPVAPSAVAFDQSYSVPAAMSEAQLQQTVEDFKAAAKRALAAGFQVVELHMAHGYLLHEFLSPLSNQRKDTYGGSLENRMRYPLRVAQAVREVWPEKYPLFVRISASDWVDDGWSIKDSVELAKKLKPLGVDLVDVSSGGVVGHVKIKIEPGYQVPFAREIKKNVPSVLVGAVGLITDSKQASDILDENAADAVFLARELLRDPYWPLRAARELKVEVRWPQQYERAKL